MPLHKLCNLDELPDLAGTEFVIEGQIIAVFRSGDQVWAVDGMCAHQGGPIAQGQLDDKCVTCPWHGWQYDICNGNNLLTGKKMLETYDIELRDQEVWISTS